jgi:ribosomal protein S18 acetylase RimI-like enzyme
MAVKIRPLTLKDAPGFRLCVGAVAAERRYLAFYKAFPLPTVRAFVRRNLRAKMPALVAVDGDRVVGWADVLGDYFETSAHVGSLGMGLLPEYRGKGLGKKLLTRIVKMAARKFEQVELAVYGKNKRAQRLYRSVGFKLCGTKKKAAKLIYGDDDVLLMQKFLGKR